MCCCNFPYLYQKLPYLHALTGFLEMICGIVRIAFFFSPISSSTNAGTTSQQYSGKYVAAFIIDWISSIVPTMVGLFTIIIIFVILFKLCACCLNMYCKSRHHGDDINTSGILRKLVRSKSIRRFFIMDCNCPCYKSRPKLRFQSRFILLCIFFILRIICIGLYASSAQNNTNGGPMAIACAISIVFLTNTLMLDFYRYRIWWHYTPQGDTRCHLKSKKHERFIPYHMVGSQRDPRTLGDRPCTDRPCQNRTLDHIAVFHGDEHQPQARWRDIPKPPPLEPGTKKTKCLCLKSDEDEDNQPHYIGFHTTTPEAAISIAHTEFQPGSSGWLGAAVYFARSTAGTIGKAKSDGGAHIIAEIRMGNVYEVEREVITRGDPKFNAEVYDYAHHTKWVDKYDTCYMIQKSEARDEFVIKDAEKQIVKWVIVIEEGYDPKVERFGLATEFDTTRCGCI